MHYKNVEVTEKQTSRQLKVNENALENILPEIYEYFKAGNFIDTIRIVLDSKRVFKNYIKEYSLAWIANNVIENWSYIYQDDRILLLRFLLFIFKHYSLDLSTVESQNMFNVINEYYQDGPKKAIIKLCYYFLQSYSHLFDMIKEVVSIEDLFAYSSSKSYSYSFYLIAQLITNNTELYEVYSYEVNSTIIAFAMNIYEKNNVDIFVDSLYCLIRNTSLVDAVDPVYFNAFMNASMQLNDNILFEKATNLLMSIIDVYNYHSNTLLIEKLFSMLDTYVIMDLIDTFLNTSCSIASAKDLIIASLSYDIGCEDEDIESKKEFVCYICDLFIETYNNKIFCVLLLSELLEKLQIVDICFMFDGFVDGLIDFLNESDNALEEAVYIIQYVLKIMYSKDESCIKEVVSKLDIDRIEEIIGESSVIDIEFIKSFIQ